MPSLLRREPLSLPGCPLRSPFQSGLGAMRGQWHSSDRVRFAGVLRLPFPPGPSVLGGASGLPGHSAGQLADHPPHPGRRCPALAHVLLPAPLLRLEMLYTTTVVSRMPTDLLSSCPTIPPASCFTQLSFFSRFGIAELACSLPWPLTAMLPSAGRCITAP